MKISKIRVLVVGPSLSGGKGGQVTHMQNIQQVFKSHSIFDTSYFSSSSGLEEQENIILKLLYSILRSISFPASLINIQTVHINTSFDNKAILRDMVLIFWSILFKRKVIVQYHGGEFTNTILAKSKILMFMWKILIKKSSEILVLTKGQYIAVDKVRQEGVSKVNNFVSLPEIKCPRKTTVFTFIFLGRIIKEKGVFDIISACRILSGRFKFKIYFFGGGDDEALLVKKILDYKLSDIIEFKGVVEGAGKDQAFLSADAFLLPTYYPEGLPYSVIEAMSYGIPVISTNAGSLCSVIDHMVTGLMVPMRDVKELAASMLLLLENPDLTSFLGENAHRKIAKEFSSRSMLELLSEKWSV